MVQVEAVRGGPWINYVLPGVYRFVRKPKYDVKKYERASARRAQTRSINRK